MTNLTKEAQYSLLADGAYWDIRSDNIKDPRNPDNSNSNWSPTPEGWVPIPLFDVSGSGASYAGSASKSGFSARAFTNGDEVVISYAGTQFGGSSPLAMLSDWTKGNVPMAMGLAAEQALEAAKFYIEVTNAMANSTLAGKKIVFTGHSLGGGLAELMAAS